ncbi:MAG: uroporphyrinogen decarboxylase [Alphaproteobacteria bacterium]|nr:uroporphyrinogen decarboxylase [Alphaproteobacteria bacterium]MCB9695348.1 uroporphyrinogen decarboxylase [Alphaproteobacteria bacterium]
MDAHTRLGNALRGLPVDRPPVWFMRQAGRYLPEYRKVREGRTFLDMCRDSDVACEVTIQPVDRFATDAAIVFSDILTIPEAMGIEVTFEAGEGPKLHNPLRTAADVDALRRPDVADALPVVPETLRKFRAQRPETPILGFAGAPFTLLCYMVEGGGSKDWIETKKMLLSEPARAHRVLDLLADVVGDYLQLQVDSGAAGVQIFDTWAGILAPDEWQAFCLPSIQRALARVKGAPRIHYTRDNMPFLHLLKQTGADVIGLDWRVDVARARAELGTLPIQGNLDPIALFGPAESIRRKVHAICDAAGPVGHVFNLGHGVTPKTPIEGVEAMIAAVKERASTSAR